MLGAWIRRKAFWFFDAIKGSSMKQAVVDIAKINSNPMQYDAQIQERIRKLLKHAEATTAYYADYVGKQLEEYPVVNKTLYKEQESSFFSSKYKKDDLWKMSTSGSTGTPFTMYQDANKRRRVLAELIYFNEICGQRIGDKYVFFRAWTDKNKKSKLEQFKTNLIPIDILHLTDENLESIRQLLKKKKITSALGYASTFDAIYDYCKRQNDSANEYKLKVAISSSEVLSDSTRVGLKKIIGCDVVNRYSNQENGVLAQSKIGETELMINKANYYIELLHLDSDTPVKLGEIGRIVVTDLFNYAFPVIRYDTGDLAIFSDERNIAFDSIQGRCVDWIYDAKGNKLTPHTWSVYMWKFDKLRQYQFIQEGPKQYVMKLNCDEGVYSKESVDEVLRDILGLDAEIAIEFVNEIPTLSSGKFKKTICNYKYDANDYINLYNNYGE